MKALVIGSGMAGVTCAHLLDKAGYHVSIFDRAPRVGGRLYTKQLDWAEFDLGAQYFTARSDAFKQQVDIWHQKGVVQLWKEQPWLTDNYHSHPSPDQQQRFIGFKNAQAPIIELLGNISLHLQQNVDSVIKRQQQWFVELSNHAQAGPFDLLILAMPLPQSKDLLNKEFIQELTLPEVEVKATQVLVVQLAEAIKTELAWSFVKDRPIDWLGQTARKPNRRASMQTWLMHFTDGATEMYKYNGDASFVKLGLMQLKQIFSQKNVAECINAYCYHHPYARVLAKNSDSNCYWNKEQQIGFCGDWYKGGRVEGAYLSGMKLAQSILELH